MTTAYVGVGSNVGDRADFCRRAVAELGNTHGVSVRSVSGLYETAPIGGPPQRSFINLVAAIETDLEPRELLETCKTIERRIGREPSGIRWGPRIVDLDILVYGEEKISERDLEIPHPRLQRRRFALIPLLEVAPEVTDPWGEPYARWADEAEGDVAYLEPF